MTRLVATAVRTATASVAPARRATPLDRSVRARSAAAIANGMIPANHSSGSDAAFAPANTPTARGRSHDLVRVSRTTYAPSAAAASGFVTWKITLVSALSANGPTTNAAAAAVMPA